MSDHILCYNCFQNRPAEPGPCPHCGFDPAAAHRYPLALPCGSILAGQYLVGRALGQGGFGITYAARDLKEQTGVAIKEYFPEGLAMRTAGTTHVSSGGPQQEEGFAYRTEALEADAMYDEIGGPLRIKELRREKEELFRSLELFYKVFFLGEDMEK